MLNEYKKYNGDVYGRVYTEDGFDTHFWKKEMTLKKFIRYTVNKEKYPGMW
jgi:hypothetical protein